MIKVLCGGGRNEKWVDEVIAEYGKRMGRFWRVEWQVVDETKFRKMVLDYSEEGWEKQSQRPYLVILDERGKMLDSPALAKMVGEKIEVGRDVVFVIGGAHGFDDEGEMRSRADYVWSLSDLVFPHQICRVVVAEQIYRAQEIYIGRPYHHK